MNPSQRFPLYPFRHHYYCSSRAIFYFFLWIAIFVPKCSSDLELLWILLQNATSFKVYKFITALLKSRYFKEQFRLTKRFLEKEFSWSSEVEQTFTAGNFSFNTKLRRDATSAAALEAQLGVQSTQKRV